MKIGLIIADDQEFEPVLNVCKENNGFEKTVHSDKYAYFTNQNNEYIAVFCGIGKVNAATATAALISTQKVDCVLSIGMSGAMQNLNHKNIVLGTKFVEHDFDLRVMGYKLGYKPQEVSIFNSDENLNKKLLNAHPNMFSGVFVSGDCFINDSTKAKFLIDEFDGVCCDMETAAVASVCYKFKVPFASIRQVSDSANEESVETYNAINDTKPDTLIKIVLKAFS